MKRQRVNTTEKGHTAPERQEVASAEEEYMSVAEAARKSGYRESHVREMCQEERIQGVRKAACGAWEIPAQAMIPNPNQA